MTAPIVQPIIAPLYVVSFDFVWAEEELDVDGFPEADVLEVEVSSDPVGVGLATLLLLLVLVSAEATVIVPTVDVSG